MRERNREKKKRKRERESESERCEGRQLTGTEKGEYKVRKGRGEGGGGRFGVTCKTYKVKRGPLPHRNFLLLPVYAA